MKKTILSALPIIFIGLTGCPGQTPTPPQDPLKIEKSCPSKATQGRVVCSIKSNRNGLYTVNFGYKVGRDSHNPGGEAWVAMKTFIGKQADLPDLKNVCSPYQKAEIENFTRLAAICQFEMKRDTPYALSAEVSTENSAGVWIDITVEPAK